MTKRGMGEVMLLSLFTLGIYLLFWLHSTRKEMVAKGANIPPLIMVVAPIAAVVIASVAWFIVMVTNMDYMTEFAKDDVLPWNTGFVAGDIMYVVMTLGWVAIMPILMFWFYRYSQGVEKVTHGRTSMAMSFGIWVVCYFINGWFVWAGIIQDGFNKADQPVGAGYGSGQQPATPTDVGNSGPTQLPPQSPAGQA